MAIQDLLNGYQHVQGGFYLKDDASTISLVSPGLNSLGYLKLFPHNRENVFGKVLILNGEEVIKMASSSGEVVRNDSPYPLKNSYSPDELAGEVLGDVAWLKDDGKERLLLFQSRQIDAYIKGLPHKPLSMEGHLKNLAKGVCKEYSCAGIGHKWKEFIRTLDLRYNPRCSHREEYQKVFDLLLPSWTLDCERMLRESRPLIESNPAFKKSTEKLFGAPAEEVLTASREQLEDMLRRRTRLGFGNRFSVTFYDYHLKGEVRRHNSIRKDSFSRYVEDFNDDGDGFNVEWKATSLGKFLRK